MQQLRILSTFSITQDTENAIEKLQKAEKELSRKGGGNLAPRDGQKLREGVLQHHKRRNAYADNAIHPHRSDFPCTFSAEATLLPLLRISRRGEMLPNVDAMAKT